MEAFSIGKHFPQKADVRFPGGPRLIDAIGREEFSRTFFEVAHDMTRTRHLSAFAYTLRSPPRILIAEDDRGGAVSREIAQHYSEKFWKLDLANKVAASPPRSSDDSWCIRTSATEIADSEYQSRCYTSVGLMNRVCVSRVDHEQNVRLHFYTAFDRNFRENELANIFSLANVFIALLLKHVSVAHFNAPMTGDSFRDRLRRLPIDLPIREIDVCEGILQGVSSEGIALRLNVSINTVRTYRKRAYARLGISSQNELMRLTSHQSDRPRMLIDA